MWVEAGAELSMPSPALQLTLVARLWKRSSSMPGRPESDELCSAIIYCLRKDFYAHTRVHAQAHAELQTARGWSNDRRVLPRGWHCPWSR